MSAGASFSQIPAIEIADSNDIRRRTGLDDGFVGTIKLNISKLNIVRRATMIRIYLYIDR